MADQTRVLLAEDDLNLGQVLSEYLALKGFEVSLYRDGMAAWDGYRQNHPDLCILDVMMPKQDGFTLAQHIRQIDSAIPIIFLTAKNMQEDRIEGFTLGGDDYITKPFSMQELLLRVQAIMRRVEGHLISSVPQSGVLKIGSMQFEPGLRTLHSADGSEVSLTNKEAQLLQLLVEHKNTTLPRSKALKRIWGDDTYYNARSMDVYITKLRKHLKPDPNTQIITVHGEGFRLVAV